MRSLINIITILRFITTCEVVNLREKRVKKKQKYEKDFT